jgi:opacity protein-like surface antigen
MKAGFVWALTLLALAARADDSDMEALSLESGQASSPASQARSWQLFVEAEAGKQVYRNDSLQKQSRSTQRVSLDFQSDVSLAPGLRGVLADRLDLNAQRDLAGHKSINTLKDANLSWQPRADAIVDLGRINQYSGVAIGYNPTDFFRQGALRSQTSFDPTLVKKNRQGSVMLRGQKLWQESSLTAMYSPALSSRGDASLLDTKWDATNRRDRGLLVFSHRLSKDLNPQWLVYKEQGSPPQLGMNITKLLKDSTVAYFEWAGGQRPSLLAQSQGQSGNKKFRNRVAAGLTYTTSNKLSLSLEYHYNGAAVNKPQWASLPVTSLSSYSRYRQFAQWEQDMPTRREVMLYVKWQDVMTNNLDLAFMLQYNIDDESRFFWAELRRHWRNHEAAVQWLRVDGQTFSTYGWSPLNQAWSMSYRYFF